MALIHKGNKLLDGRVSAIKQQYKSNTFEVGLETKDPEGLRKELSQRFPITDTNFKSIHEDLKLQIQIAENASPNDLLIFLTSRATVNHFVEVIPSVNDIFIKTVTTHA